MTVLDPPRRGDGKFAPYAAAEAELDEFTTVGHDPVLDGAALIELDEVFHVGTFDAADRKSSSYEGDGLSVSVDPDDWAQIAKLPGDTWSLERTDGEPLRFVAWHDLDESARDRVRNWGAERGYIEQKTAHRASWFDDEWDDTFSSDFATAEEAAYEFEDQEGVEISEVSVWRPTSSFPQARVRDDDDPTDLLLGAYIAEHRPDLDGVWWEDNHDPDRLSCPRGVLVHDLDRYERRPA